MGETTFDKTSEGWDAASAEYERQFAPTQRCLRMILSGFARRRQPTQFWKSLQVPEL